MEKRWLSLLMAFVLSVSMFGAVAETVATDTDLDSVQTEKSASREKFEEAWTYFGQGFTSLKAGFRALFDETGSFMQGWFDEAGQYMESKLTASWEWMKGAYERISEAVIEKVNTIQKYATEHTGEVEDSMQEAWNTLLEAATEGSEMAKEKVQEAYDTLSAWLETMSEENADEKAEAIQALEELAREAGIELDVSDEATENSTDDTDN